MRPIKDESLLDCCKPCEKYTGENHDFAVCAECPVLKLYRKCQDYRRKVYRYKPYYDDAIWGPSDCIGDRHEMGSW